jgi:hypothetical protein
MKPPVPEIRVIGTARTLRAMRRWLKDRDAVVTLSHTHFRIAARDEKLGSDAAATLVAADSDSADA